MRHDRVADVELADLANRGDRLHVVVVQAVARVDFQPQPGGIVRGFAMRCELLLLFRARARASA